jgi:hypothetical protein
MILLGSCGKMVYRTNLEVYCPTLKTYPEHFDETLADELVAADDYTDMSYTIEALEDYRILRKKIEACKKEASKGVN